MHPHSLVAFLSIYGATALIVLAAIIYCLFATIRMLSSSDERARSLSRLRFALFGGILFTSSPFWSLLTLFIGHQWPPVELFLALPIMNSMKYQLSWIPNFFIGYSLFAWLWARYNRSKSENRK